MITRNKLLLLLLTTAHMPLFSTDEASKPLELDNASDFVKPQATAPQSPPSLPQMLTNTAAPSANLTAPAPMTSRFVSKEHMPQCPPTPQRVPSWRIRRRQGGGAGASADTPAWAKDQLFAVSAIPVTYYIEPALTHDITAPLTPVFGCPAPGEIGMHLGPDNFDAFQAHALREFKSYLAGTGVDASSLTTEQLFDHAARIAKTPLTYTRRAYDTTTPKPQPRDIKSLVTTFNFLFAHADESDPARLLFNQFTPQLFYYVNHFAKQYCKAVINMNGRECIRNKSFIGRTCPHSPSNPDCHDCHVIQCHEECCNNATELALTWGWLKQCMEKFNLVKEGEIPLAPEEEKEEELFFDNAFSRLGVRVPLAHREPKIP